MKFTFEVIVFYTFNKDFGVNQADTEFCSQGVSAYNDHTVISLREKKECICLQPVAIIIHVSCMHSVHNLPFCFQCAWRCLASYPGPKKGLVMRLADGEFVEL